MASFRIAVILCKSDNNLVVRVPNWYQDYFFDLDNGQAAYWFKQSGGQVFLTGDVIPWFSIGSDNVDLMKRASVLAYAMGKLGGTVVLGGYSSVAVVLALRPGLDADAGSTTGGIVVSDKSGFDFVAHELGHQLHLNHSFGDPAFKMASWSAYGEYGHPYCVMSAQSYGYRSALGSRSSLDAEYSPSPPSLNAGTALGHGWIPAVHRHNLSAGSADFSIHSRDWPAVPEQALELTALNGQTYVIEYRRIMGWDSGLPTARVIVNHVKGSTADQIYPNTSAATYLGEIRLPIELGSLESVFNHPAGEFGIQVLDWPSDAMVTLRVVPQRVPTVRYTFTEQLDLLHADTIETGTETFKPGELRCVQGQWDWTKLAQYQEARFEMTVPGPAQQDPSFSWSVDGLALDPQANELRIPYKLCKDTDSRFATTTRTRQVRLAFEIKSYSAHSVLTLRNEPLFGTFSGEVQCTYQSKLCRKTVTSRYDFEGHRIQYPQEFYDKLNACLRAWVKELLDHRRAYNVDIDISHIRSLNRRARVMLDTYNNALAILKEELPAKRYGQFKELVARSLRIPTLLTREARMEPLHLSTGRSAFIDLPASEILKLTDNNRSPR